MAGLNIGLVKVKNTLDSLNLNETLYEETKFTFIDIENIYNKTPIKYKGCGHIANLCLVGLQREVRCKICFGSTVKDRGHGTNKHRLSKAKEYSAINMWGVLYYIKIKGFDYYKIGISSNGPHYRFQKGFIEEVIFTTPFSSQEEALGAEKLLLTIYNNYTLPNSLSKKELEEYKDVFPDGYTEVLVTDVLGSDFDFFKFKENILRSLNKLTKGTLH